jgi:type IV pilus assembly protein PilW
VKRLPENNNRGFSLIELLIAMAVGLIVLGAVYSVFIIQNKTYKVQDQIAEMQQNARAGMDIMTGEIMMAGFNPADTAFDGVTYSTLQLQIRADLDGDGTPDDASENIIYSHDTTNLQIDRDTGGGAQPLIENVQAFTFEYLDGNGTATTTTANIRQVRITITMRTADPDPDYTPNGGYRTYVLSSVIIPRNLGLL